MGLFESIRRNVTEAFRNAFSADTIQFHSLLLDDIYREIFPIIEKSAIQLVYFDTDTISDFQNTLWRERARDVSVQRIYCVPNLGKAQFLHKQLQDDHEKGVVSYVLILSKLSQGQLSGEIREFSLFDEQYTIISRGEINKRSQFDFSIRTDDIERIKAIMNGLKNSLMQSTEFLTKKFDLEEPLLTSADIINAVGQVLCICIGICNKYFQRK